MEYFAQNGSPCAQIAALEKITNQLILADKAKNGYDVNVRIAAIKNLTDQSVLADVVKNDTHQIVRETALWKIKDQFLLADIVKNANDERTMIMAKNRLKDKSILEDIEKNAVCGGIWKNHNFVYESPYHVGNTGFAERKAKCTRCGHSETQSYGYDDSW